MTAGKQSSGASPPHYVATRELGKTEEMWEAFYYLHNIISMYDKQIFQFKIPWLL